MVWLTGNLFTEFFYTKNIYSWREGWCSVCFRKNNNLISKLITINRNISLVTLTKCQHGHYTSSIVLRILILTSCFLSSSVTLDFILISFRSDPLHSTWKLSFCVLTKSTAEWLMMISRTLEVDLNKGTVVNGEPHAYFFIILITGWKNTLICLAGFYPIHNPTHTHAHTLYHALPLSSTPSLPRDDH